MRLTGSTASSLIDARGGPGSGRHDGHAQSYFGKGGGHTVSAAFVTGAVLGVMTALAEAANGSTATATALEPPTELTEGDLGAYIEAHQDLWNDPEAVVVARPKGKKNLVVMAVKITTSKGLRDGNSTRAPGGAVMTTEYAMVNRRSVFPRRWGSEPYDAEERAAWILYNVRREREMAGALASKYRVLQLLARRHGP